MPYIINGMRDLLARGENLPTLPTVVFQLHNLLDNELAGAREVAAIVERDPAIAARLLRTANSSAFAGTGGRVGSISAAVSRLGVNQVRAICIVLAVVKAFQGRSRGLDHNAFWVHSAAVGMLASQLWNRFGKPGGEVTAEGMYVAGLLHDAGLLVLEQHFPEEFTAVLQAQAADGGRLWQVEEDQLGMDHGAVGGLLLGRWELPRFIAEAVTHHHRPHEADEEFREVCRVVQAAEVICTEHGSGLAVEGSADFSTSDVLTELGADEETIEEIEGEVPRVAEQARRFLG